jgi:hypothetical protein
MRRDLGSLYGPVARVNRRMKSARVSSESWVPVFGLGWESEVGTRRSAGAVGHAAGDAFERAQVTQINAAKTYSHDLTVSQVRRE